MIIFPPMLTFATIGLITVAGIFDEFKNTKMVNYLKLVDKLATQPKMNDMELTKELMRINWNEFKEKQNTLKEIPQKFVCPFSGEQEFILINQ